eukprot:1006359-Pleurochrysis_carterae.AAC.1
MKDDAGSTGRCRKDASEGTDKNKHKSGCREAFLDKCARRRVGGTSAHDGACAAPGCRGRAERGARSRAAEGRPARVSGEALAQLCEAQTRRVGGARKGAREEISRAKGSTREWAKDSGRVGKEVGGRSCLWVKGESENESERAGGKERLREGEGDGERNRESEGRRATGR